MINPRQGRRQDQIESNEKIAVISVCVLLSVLAITFIVNLIKHLL
jgi:hypothetical protein